MKYSKLLPIFGFTILMAGCATGELHHASVMTGFNPAAEPGPVYVKNFDASRAEFVGDYSDVEAKVKMQRSRIPEIITTELIAYLGEKGRKAGEYSGAPQSGLIVTGTVTHVDAGSGAARFWVGLGAGASHVRAKAYVYRVSNPNTPVATLDLEGHSGGTGGMWGYQDWVGANSKDLAIRLGKFLMGEQ